MDYLPLSAILTAEVVTVPPATPLRRVLRDMEFRRISCVVVADAQGQPLGIFTERDAVLLLAGGADLEATAVERVMSGPVFAVAASLDYRDAYQRMSERGIRHLVAVGDDGRLVGVASEADFLQHMGEEYLVEVKTVAAAMDRHVLTQDEGATLAEAAAAMRRRETDYVVVTRAGQPAGLLTERDIVRLASRRADRGKSLGALMTAGVQAIAPEEPVQEAVRRMREAGVRRLLVMTPRGVEGVITRHDIVKAMQGRYVEYLRETISRLRHQLPPLGGRPNFQHQTLLGGVLDRIPDGVYLVDGISGRIIDANERGCDMLGYGREQLQDLSIWQLAENLPDEPAWREWQAQANGGVRVFETRHRRRDGAWLPVEVRVYRVSEGEEPLFVGIARDLAAARQAEAALHDSEARLHTLIEALPDAVYVKDGEGHWQIANAAGLRVFNLLGEDWQGRDEAALARLRPELAAELAACRASDEAAWQTGAMHRSEEVVPGEDGQPHYWDVVKQPLFNADGSRKSLLAVARDVTERRRAEETLRLAAQVFENSGEAIMITDGSSRIVSVNRAFTEISGYLPDEAIGRKPALLASGRHDPAFYGRMWRSLAETGYWQGEIWNRRKSGEVYPEWLGISTLRDHHGRVSHYVAIFSDISERKAAEARIEFLAHHDPLTNLPNRLLFKDRLEQAVAHAERAGTKVALLFTDLDRFKTVNDSLGHPVGDLLLGEAAARLQGCIRDTDTVSRQGGDEFLVALTDLRDSDAATRVAEKVLAALAKPFLVRDHEIAISGSVGIAVFPEDGRDFDSLLKKADIAMYHAKEAGRNAFRYYTERMNIDALERLDLQNRLRRGLERREFVLHYQPLVELASRRIVGAEALVRWQSPDGGLVLPGRFIPVAEESGLIVPLGEWVLQEACRELRRWHEAGHGHLSMAVNLSAIQFRRGNLAESVAEALRLSGAAAASLELELTESILLHGAEQVLAAVQRLKALGVRLSIDDFGTGYSNLAYLRRFAVDKLKIDQSFVRDLPTSPDSAAIVRAVIQMAKSLNLSILAEGVETEEIAAGLRLFRCDYVQGYHFGRPVPAEEFRRLLK